MLINNCDLVTRKYTFVVIHLNSKCIQVLLWAVRRGNLRSEGACSLSGSWMRDGLPGACGRHPAEPLCSAHLRTAPSHLLLPNQVKPLQQKEINQMREQSKC